MIPRNIDLTENGDFGKPQRNQIYITEIFQNYVYKECEVLTTHEKIFGKKRHDTEKANVFYNENTYIEKLKKHCVKCGCATIYIPWKNSSLCNSCENIVEKQTHPFLWYIYSKNVSLEIDLAKEVFKLR